MYILCYGYDHVETLLISPNNLSIDIFSCKLLILYLSRKNKMTNKSQIVKYLRWSYPWVLTQYWIELVLSCFYHTPWPNWAIGLTQWTNTFEHWMLKYSIKTDKDNKIFLLIWSHISANQHHLSWQFLVVGVVLVGWHRLHRSKSNFQSGIFYYFYNMF